MADIDVPQATLNGDADPAIDDGEEAESKVSLLFWLHSQSFHYPHRKFS